MYLSCKLLLLEKSEIGGLSELCHASEHNLDAEQANIFIV